MKHGIRLLSLLLAIVLLCGTLTGCASVTRPLQYFKRSLIKTIERRFGGDMLELLPEMLESGSLAVTYGGTDLAETPLENAELKLFFNREEQSVSAVGAVGVGGKRYDGKAFFTSEKLVVSSEAFLGSTDFGVDFATLEKDLANSIFRNNSNTAFANPRVGDGAAADILLLKNDFFLAYDSVSDLLTLSDELTEEFLSALTEFAPHNRYSEDGRWYLELTVENVSLSRALRETRTRVVKDRDFCRELRELAKIRDDVISVRTGTRVSEWSNKVENFIASPLEMEDICAKIDAMPAFALILNAAVGRWSGIIERLSVAFDYVGGERVLAFEADLTDESTNVLRLTYGGAVRTLTYRVNKDGMRHYDAELSYEKAAVGGERELLITGSLAADRKADSFTLSLAKGEETRVFYGSFDREIDSFSMAVDRVTVNGEAHQFACSVTVRTEDKAEKMPAYENFATVSEHRFQPISERMESSVAELKAAWGESDTDWRSTLCFLLTVAGAPEEIASIPDPKPVPPAE